MNENYGLFLLGWFLGVAAYFGLAVLTDRLVRKHWRLP